MPSAYVVVYAPAVALSWNKDNREINLVLVARKRATVPNNPGQHVFPGGRRDPGETVPQAACREFREETGIAVELFHNRILSMPQAQIQDYTATDFGHFGALYLQVGVGALKQVCDNANRNIRDGNVTDPELAEVKIVQTSVARAKFVSEHIATDARRRTEWFRTIVDSLPD